MFKRLIYTSILALFVHFQVNAAVLYTSTQRVLAGNKVSENQRVFRDLIPQTSVTTNDGSTSHSLIQDTVSFSGLNAENESATMQLDYRAEATVGAGGVLKSGVKAATTLHLYLSV